MRWTTSSSPSRIVPAPSVPVTTVPLPRTEKDRSTQRRVRPRRSGAGRRGDEVVEGGPEGLEPWPVRADTASAALPARPCAATCSSASASGGAGVGEVAARHDERGRARCRGRRTAARCSADWGRQPSSAATTSRTAGAGPSPASMLPMKRSCPGTSTKATSRPRGQGRPGVAEVDRHAATALLGPPVGLDAGERPHEGGLAVVDVAGGRDDVHVSGRSGRRRRGPPGSARSTSGSRRRRDAAQVDEAAAPLDAARRRRARRAADARRRPRGARRPSPAGAAPGAPPPPTRPLDGTTSPATAAARRSVRARSRVEVGVEVVR